MKKIILPLTNRAIKNLRVGQEVSLSGVVYTARDQAHKRLVEAINKYRRIPLNLKGAIIYYSGPTPARKGKVIGSCGPTTSSRMDKFTPHLLSAGLKGMIGKGTRSCEVISAIKNYKAVYFLTYAGCGALMSKFIKKREVIAYSDLGTEAIHRLEVKDFPVIVGVDCRGKNIYK